MKAAEKRWLADRYLETHFVLKEGTEMLVQDLLYHYLGCIRREELLRFRQFFAQVRKFGGKFRKGAVRGIAPKDPIWLLVRMSERDGLTEEQLWSALGFRDAPGDAPVLFPTI